jgi:ATP-binding cassette subfamily C protein CydD
VKSQELRLLLSLGSSRKLVFGAIFGALVNTAIVIGNALLIAAVIVGLIYDHPNISTHITGLCALWLFRAFFTSQFDRWASVEASRLKDELRRLLTSSESALTSISSTELSTLLVKGSNSLDIYLAKFLPQMMGAALTPIAVIALIGYLDLTSAVIAVATIPIIPFFGALIGRYTNDAVKEKWSSLGTLAHYFEDSLRGVNTLAIFGRHRSQGERIQVMGDRYTSETMKVLKVSFLSALVLELAATISVALIAVSIGLRLVGGDMQFFPALAILVLAPEVYFPLRNAASLFHASADGSEALSRLIAISRVELKPIFDGSRSLTAVESVSWKAFQSPYGPGVLDANSVTAGEVLVIRGGSGLGKTTFLNSILGFNASTEVTINGAPLSQYEKADYLSCIGWIPQSPALIDGSLREVFTFVRPAISDSEISELLERAGIPLAELPAGLETHISGLSEKSGKISGGQKRRIAIARALINDPSLIIADEPTADLDPQSAAHVLTLLADVARAGAIVIAVMHAPDQSIHGAQEIVMGER